MSRTNSRLPYKVAQKRAMGREDAEVIEQSFIPVSKLLKLARNGHKITTSVEKDYGPLVINGRGIVKDYFAILSRPHEKVGTLELVHKNKKMLSFHNFEEDFISSFSEVLFGHPNLEKATIDDVERNELYPFEFEGYVYFYRVRYGDVYMRRGTDEVIPSPKEYRSFKEFPYFYFGTVPSKEFKNYPVETDIEKHTSLVLSLYAIENKPVQVAHVEEKWITEPATREQEIEASRLAFGNGGGWIRPGKMRFLHAQAVASERQEMTMSLNDYAKAFNSGFDVEDLYDLDDTGTMGRVKDVRWFAD